MAFNDLYFLDQCRILAFPSTLFFVGERLINHTIANMSVIDRDTCEYRCYLDYNCVSVNFYFGENGGEAHNCELNNSTAKEYEEDLVQAGNFVYHGTKAPASRDLQENDIDVYVRLDLLATIVKRTSTNVIQILTTAAIKMSFAKIPRDRSSAVVNVDSSGIYIIAQTYAINGQKISHFQFPSDKALRQKWIQAIRRDVGDNFVIDDRHTKWRCNEIMINKLEENVAALNDQLKKEAEKCYALNDEFKSFPNAEIFESYLEFLQPSKNGEKIKYKNASYVDNNYPGAKPDIDECVTNTHNCSKNTNCANTEGSYNCSCNPGFSGDIDNFTDIDEWVKKTHNCSENTDCINTEGSYNCSCNPGYGGDGRKCQDIDEFSQNSHNCSNITATCNNTKGSFKCICKPGFSGDGYSCTDIDECAENIHNCSKSKATCTNSKGSFNCSCNPGLKGDGYNCTADFISDINECVQNHNCSENANCTNTEGSYNCSSNPGFSGDGHGCEVLPLQEHGFNLSKREFRDAVKLRYDWPFDDIPSVCACGENFTVDHAMICKRGGFVIQRHNELRDLEADLLSIVCTDVEVEPVLQDVTEEQLSRGSNRAQDARLDVRARGFWDPQSSALFDVRVCHPNAESYRDREPQQTYRIHENDNKWLYSRRVLDVEQARLRHLYLQLREGWGWNA
ncbi:Fibrillin-1 [Stylophora pistillata]|uniref:Fibrillin-1 n=1 Tax=Stylophora pistillata TaxID=50429 RepID=A0A2B4RAH7_STYPI|nr:Fibrillin-1 [Stylophora pistillata]